MRQAKRCRHCKGVAAEPPLLTLEQDRQVRTWYLCERGWMMLEFGFRELRPRDDFYQYLVPLGTPPRDSEVYLYVMRGSALFGRLSGLAP